MKKQLALVSIMTVLVMVFLALSAFASPSRIYLSEDNNGDVMVWDIQEGDTVFIAVYDSDQNKDCDIRDKFWADIKLFDPKTGANLDWESYETADVATYGYTGRDGSLSIGYYMEETSQDSNLFVSNVSFKIGTRKAFTFIEQQQTHWVGALFDDVSDFGAAAGVVNGGLADGSWEYVDGVRSQLSVDCCERPTRDGRFENMDSLVLMYQDPSDPGDVAVGMAKIVDVRATIKWVEASNNDDIISDGNEAATILVYDEDENLNCNEIEYVPVFIIVNPGSWNPIQSNGTYDFCSLKKFGGVNPAPAVLATQTASAVPSLNQGINWSNIYDSGLTEAGVDLAAATAVTNAQPDEDGSYYIQYPNANNEANGTSDGFGGLFDTRTFNGETRVSFYAQETAVDSGIFELSLNQVLLDLGFNSLDNGDVLVAYYLDPNDEDDFTLATAYIEDKGHLSDVKFTDSGMNPMNQFWIGRDDVSIRVVDAGAAVDSCVVEKVIVKVCDVHEDDDVEWVTLYEDGPNSSIFFSYASQLLDPVWDARGIGIDTANRGGFQLVLDNFDLEAYNEDAIYVRYNDVRYFATGTDSLSFINDQSTDTAFPPMIAEVNVDNDVAFDLLLVRDYQVAQGPLTDTTMVFLDGTGRVLNPEVDKLPISDGVYIRVTDVDQNENTALRERIDAFWDGYQNLPFGPADWTDNHGSCGYYENTIHDINSLLGDTNIFSGPQESNSQNSLKNTAPDQTDSEVSGASRAKIYVLNPRNGLWAPVDLFETAPNSGIFESLERIDLDSLYSCVPSLGVKADDTVVAFYQDPSNHSDSAMISIKVRSGGSAGVVVPGTDEATVMFAYANGQDAGTTYNVDETVYVKVIDPSQAGSTSVTVAIDGEDYTAAQFGTDDDTFMTEGLELITAVGQVLEADYNGILDEITVVQGTLDVESFFIGPNPFVNEVTFGYATGKAEELSVKIYNLAGDLVYASEIEMDEAAITWDGTDLNGATMANGAYIYVLTAVDSDAGTDTQTGKVFINR